MSKIDLKSFAASLPQVWHSRTVGRPCGANLKVVRLDDSAYPEEVHAFDEALLVLEGQMNLQIQGHTTSVSGGDFIVPAGVPHAVAPGSSGTLIIVDAVQ